MNAAGSDQPVEPPESDDPTRGVRRLLVLLLVLAIVAAGGAFALSQRDPSSTTRGLRPRLFAAEFSQKGFLSGTATLLTSYDAEAAQRTATGAVKTRGTIYVVARCQVGTVRVVLAGLSSSQPCTGAPIGLVALNLTQPAQLTATVTAAQRTRWGVAIYR